MRSVGSCSYRSPGSTELQGVVVSLQALTLRVDCIPASRASPMPGGPRVGILRKSACGIFGVPVFWTPNACVSTSRAGREPREPDYLENYERKDARRLAIWHIWGNAPTNAAQTEGCRADHTCGKPQTGGR